MLNKPANWDDFEENEVVSSETLPVDAYPAQIKRVEDVPNSEYLKIEFDIVKGKYTNYFAQMKENLKLPDWPNQGVYYASYKEKATKFFKAFITAVQKSNQGYVWDWNPNSLIGKFMIANFGEEEYLGPNDEIKISVKAREIRSIEAWKKGDVKKLELKKLKLKTEPINNPFENLEVNISDDDLPF